MSTHVLLLEIDVYIPTAQSLKDKRRVIRAVQDGVRQAFRLPVAEVGFQESWQRARLAVVSVGADRGVMAPLIDRIHQAVLERLAGEVVRFEVQWFQSDRAD